MSEEWVSASDIEKFGYCPLSWWLSREDDVITEELERGTKEHHEIGELLGDVKEKEERSHKFEHLVLWLAVAASVVSIMGLTLIESEQVFYQIFIVLSLIWLLAAVVLLYLSETGIFKSDSFTFERLILVFAMVATILVVFSYTLRLSDEMFAMVAQIISLSWLVGASYWLKHSLALTQEASKKRRLLAVRDGEVKYVDRPKKTAKLLMSEKHKVRGRPDYILEIDGEDVPVEVKTGRTPKGPFFSHILQIASYCLLLEEENGQRPSYGIVKYGDTEFEIDYDETLKELLLAKLDEMRKLRVIGEAHRNHNREGKCRNCSRRDICPESLV